MLLKTGARFLSLIYRIVVPTRNPGWLRYFWRLAVLTVLFPPFVLLQLIHWIGFTFDEILFRGYRRIQIRNPVFVVGVPRSGTTFLHRLLATDPGFATFSTWECLFAPSISERLIVRAVASADRWCGRPLRRLLDRAEALLLERSAGIHPTGLREPEEDYLCFLPVLCCFILILPFPSAPWVWGMAYFDRDLAPRDRQALLGWYRRCLQKHLYVHGEAKVLLSKNASFAGMVNGLVNEFAGARFVVCQRDAVAVIRSQLNSLEPSMRLFGIAANDPSFRRKLVDCLDFYYRNLDTLCASLPQSLLVRIALPDLSRNTRCAVELLYRQFGLALPAAVDAAISDYEAGPVPINASRPRELEEWGLDERELGRRFAPWLRERRP
ncbi:MAG: sulfotransferase [Gammaproteobacteria bacterium]|jgi:hypothetical protein